MSLGELGLSEEIVKAAKKRGYTEETPIQKALIPAIFSGKDVMASAETGSGKTAAFAFPILDIISKESLPDKHYPKAVIIVPTRELAKQVHSFFLAYGERTALRSILLFGGSNMTKQAKGLALGQDIIIATSGRLLEHAKQKNIDLSGVKHLVLDEADTILDMGFVKEVGKLIEYLPKVHQSILVSATLTGAVKRLAQDILVKPMLIEVSKKKYVSTIEQVVYPVIEEKKDELLTFLIGSKNYKQVLLFVRKKERAESVLRELNDAGLPALAIHGNKSTGDRSRALKAFVEKKIRVLVATDIAARGLDIPSLEVVINYDIPHVNSDYIHRIGRTGRAGKSGLAVTLISPKEMVALADVEKLLGKKIPKIFLEEYAPTEPLEQRGARATQEKKRVDGAFGNKRKNTSSPAKKKRKTTKRDGFKAYDAAKPKAENKNKNNKRTRGRK